MKSFAEKQFQEQLQKDTPVPDILEKKVRQAYLQIQSGQISQEETIRSPYRWIKRAGITLGCAAAAFFFCMILFLTTRLWRKISPESEISSVCSRTKLVSSEILRTTPHRWSVPLRTDWNPKTILPPRTLKTPRKLSARLRMDSPSRSLKCTADPLAVYLTVLIENDEPFPDSFVDQNGDQTLCLSSSPGWISKKAKTRLFPALLHRGCFPE